MRVLTGHTAGVRCLAYSPDGQSLASGSDDHSVRLWSLASDQPPGESKEHRDWVRGVAFSPDGRLLASAGWDDTVWVWSTTTRREPRAFRPKAFAGGTWSVAFVPDGSGLAAGAGNGIVHIRERNLQGHRGPVSC